MLLCIFVKNYVILNFNKIFAKIRSNIANHGYNNIIFLWSYIIINKLLFEQINIWADLFIVKKWLKLANNSCFYPCQLAIRIICYFYIAAVKEKVAIQVLFEEFWPQQI